MNKFSIFLCVFVASVHGQSFSFSYSYNDDKLTRLQDNFRDLKGAEGAEGLLDALDNSLKKFEGENEDYKATLENMQTQIADAMKALDESEKDALAEDIESALKEFDSGQEIFQEIIDEYTENQAEIEDTDESFAEKAEEFLGGMGKSINEIGNILNDDDDGDDGDDGDNGDDNDDDDK